jgi:hypothetical protein
MPTSDKTASPEAQLLLLCARSDPSLMLAAIQEVTAKPLDWTTFLALGAEHRVLSLIYISIKESTSIFPPEVTIALKDYYLNNVRNTMALTVQTRRLLALFNANAVDVIPYKGLALAAKAYPDEAVREIMDIDLVIQQRDLARGHSLLIKEGYESADNFNNLMSILRTQHRAYMKSNRLIEIHWRFLPDLFMLAPAAIWNSAKPEFICGESALQVTPEDMVILLCTHGTSHWWLRLSHVCDLTEFIRCNAQLDWHKVTNRAKQAHVLRMVNVGLLVAVQLMQAPISTSLITDLQTDQIATKIASEICTTFFDRPSEGRYREQVEISRNLMVRERLIDKVGYLLQNLLLGELTEQDLNWIHLPRKIAFLYPIFRPVRLIMQYAPRIIFRR